MVSVKFNKWLFKLYMQYFELLHVKDKSDFVDVLKLSDSKGMHVK
jgi:hypothetical protein